MGIGEDTSVAAGEWGCVGPGAVCGRGKGEVGGVSNLRLTLNCSQGHGVKGNVTCQSDCSR